MIARTSNCDWQRPGGGRGTAGGRPGSAYARALTRNRRPGPGAAGASARPGAAAACQWVRARTAAAAGGRPGGAVRQGRHCHRHRMRFEVSVDVQLKPKLETH